MVNHGDKGMHMVTNNPYSAVIASRISECGEKRFPTQQQQSLLLAQGKSAQWNHAVDSPIRTEQGFTTPAFTFQSSFCSLQSYSSVPATHCVVSAPFWVNSGDWWAGELVQNHLKPARPQSELGTWPFFPFSYLIWTSALSAGFHASHCHHMMD